MAKLTAEEKHKRQLAKMQAQNETENTYEEPKTEKDMAIEALSKKGFKSENVQGVPMFTIKTQEEADKIISGMNGKGSFGFRYAKDAKISFQ